MQKIEESKLELRRAIQYRISEIVANALHEQQDSLSETEVRVSTPTKMTTMVEIDGLFYDVTVRRR